MLIYVNANAFRNGNGTEAMPFKTINEAAIAAKPGDTVLVAPGLYREHVVPLNAGTEDNPIVYRSMEPKGAVISGAEQVTEWKPYQNDVWTARVNNGLFGDNNPYTTYVCGDWYFAPTVRHTGSVYYNDHMLYESVTLEECIAGEADPCSWVPEESKMKWYCEQEGGETVFYVNLHGLNPNNEKMEISVRRNVFMPKENGINYITVSGFKLEKAATTWAPPAAYQDGLIGPHWAKGWIIEDCEICNSKCCGISLGKYCDPENDMYFYTKHVKSPTQMERDAVCRGQYHGWLKEKIGHHIIRRCEIHHCEQTGIVGRMGAVFSTIEDCHIHHICNSQQLGGAETAGIKLHAAIDVVVRRNHIHNCIMGVWFDWQAQGARITENLMYNNHPPKGAVPAEGAMFSQDVFIEVGHGPTLIDNNILLSKQSVCMPSEGIACVHNLMLGSFTLINSGVDSVVNGQREPRYTPYHIRHRTEVAGFMTILHGDDRIYNNIIVQGHEITDPGLEPSSNMYQTAGTAPFDIFPSYEEWIANFDFDHEPDMGALATYHFGHLPVWVKGNAYCNKATVSKHEKHGLEVKEPVTVELEQKDNHIILKTNLYQYLKDFKDGIISTEILGKAFEPEQRFENRDGTDIIFNRDYFGNHRETATIPGPFANPVTEIVIW